MISASTLKVGDLVIITDKAYPTASECELLLKVTERNTHRIEFKLVKQIRGNPKTYSQKFIKGFEWGGSIATMIEGHKISKEQAAVYLI